MYQLKPTYPMNQITADLIMNTKPPTLYSILNSIANYDNENPVKIRELAIACHDKIFDFDYELSEALNKNEFEIDILNHFMMRRIGFETVTAFQLYLENKLKEILPYYNLMFDSFKDYNLFGSGETITRQTSDNKNVVNESNSIGETRYSKYPMNQLEDINNGSYVSEQTRNTINNNSNSTDNTLTNETINRSPVDKMSIYKSFLETKQSVMSMIYKELNSLFYGLAD